MRATWLAVHANVFTDLPPDIDRKHCIAWPGLCEQGLGYTTTGTLAAQCLPNV